MHPRPPRAPSSYSKAKVQSYSYKPRYEVGFRKKVAGANQTTICNATHVSRLSVKDLLTMDQCYEVPIFQRRYCWGPAQWETLLSDAFRSPGMHSLGRLTCTHSQLGCRSFILDGQQRFTTVTILLASIRDALITEHKSTSVRENINCILFPQNGIAWSGSEISSMDGIDTSSAKLIPSFCDRKAYYSAILPGSSKRDFSLSQDLPLQAKMFFDKKLAIMTEMDLHKLYHSVMNGFSMLYFPIDVDKGSKDGTEDLMVVYERLALRDATFTKPTRVDEYVSMGGCDMIRNLLLGSFVTDTDDCTEFYHSYWLPLEKAVESASKSSNTSFDLLFTDMLEAFIGAQDHDEVVVSGLVGGKLYAAFACWYQCKLEQSKCSVEDTVREIGRLILEFTRNELKMNSS